MVRIFVPLSQLLLSKPMSCFAMSAESYLDFYICILELFLWLASLTGKDSYRAFCYYCRFKSEYFLHTEKQLLLTKEWNCSETSWHGTEPAWVTDHLQRCEEMWGKQCQGSSGCRAEFSCPYWLKTFKLPWERLNASIIDG